jgi:hypothetical protein
MPIELEETHIISVDAKELSLYQYNNGDFFKKPLNTNTWNILLIENSCRLSKLTVAFTIYEDPEKLGKNAEHLSKCLLELYRDNILIRWQVKILQIQYLNEHSKPLTINELDAWAEHWCIKGEHQKKAVFQCINIIADFSNDKMDLSNNCFFTELEIIGYFRGARYILPDWESNTWKACSHTIVNNFRTRISLNTTGLLPPDPYMEPLSTFSLSLFTKKVRICYTQIQNWIFNGSRRLLESLEIKNANVMSHVAIRDSFHYFELDLGTLKFVPIVDTNIAQFQKKDSWLLHKHPHPDYTDYYICKELPQRPSPPESYPQKSRLSGCCFFC